MTKPKRNPARLALARSAAPSGATAPTTATRSRPAAPAATATSPKRAAAARENGRQGGRPRSQLPAEVVARLGPPPGDPLELARWYQRLLAEVTLLLATGGIDRGLAGAIRGMAGTAARQHPVDVIAEADRRLRESDKQMRVREGGAPLEEVPADGEQPGRAVRCAPR